ncbi:MAG: riboflavin synthase [Candidatus Omnitrophota bacterium]|jgi:riboflavin synthase
MFTGIIEELGTIKKITKKTNLSVLEVSAKKVITGMRIGDSVAINGVCLSIIKKTKTTLSFDVMRETLILTSIGHLKVGEKVNLERAMRATDRLNGHVVTGHVDHMGVITALKEDENYLEVRVKINPKFKKYIVQKGSICLDGISLTVGAVTKTYFSVYLIPITRKLTTLGFKGKGDYVNIETDIFARYLLENK